MNKKKILIQIPKSKIKKSLSNSEIESHGISFMTYPELKNKNLRDLSLPLCILYMNGKNYGHFTCLFENSEGLNMFDSLGYKPDGEFSFADKKLNFVSRPYLSRILLEYKGKIIYNEIELQSDNNEVATCGRWVIVRCKYSYLTQDMFVEFIRRCSKRLNLTNDEVITLMTYDH